jgi:hypothetical protein
MSLRGFLPSLVAGIVADVFIDNLASKDPDAKSHDGANRRPRLVLDQPSGV